MKYQSLSPVAIIRSQIHVVREQKINLDSNLAFLYKGKTIISNDKYVEI